MLEIRSHADCHDHAASACGRIKTSWLGMVLISTSLSFFRSGYGMTKKIIPRTCPASVGLLRPLPLYSTRMATEVVYLPLSLSLSVPSS